MMYGVRVSEGAICKVGKLHRFTTVDDVNTDGKYITGATTQVCIFCGERRIYTKWKGVIDNYTYLQDHIRDTVQPTGSTRKLFEWIYGKLDKKGNTHGDNTSRENT